MGVLCGKSQNLMSWPQEIAFKKNTFMPSFAQKKNNLHKTQGNRYFHMTNLVSATRNISINYENSMETAFNHVGAY